MLSAFISIFLSCKNLFDLILYVPSTIFQLNRDGSSWVEPVLSWDKCVLLKDHNAVKLVRLEPTALWSRMKHSTTEPLRSLSCKNRFFFYVVCKKWASTRNFGIYHICKQQMLRCVWQYAQPHQSLRFWYTQSMEDQNLTLIAPIMTAADNKVCLIFPNF